MSFENIEEECTKYFESHKIESLSLAQQTRFLKSAAANFEQQFFKDLYTTLTDATKHKMDMFLKSEADHVSFSTIKGNNP
ncbi:MAG: hypothetical protein HEEMFOPI_02066 [Holosporales bacterium]